VTTKLLNALKAHVRAVGGVTGVDTSHWQGIPTQAQIDCLWDHGFRFWVVGLQDPTIFVPTLRRLRGDGRFRTEGYEYLYQSQGPEKMVRDSIAQLKSGGVDDTIGRLWLDYEAGAELAGDGEVDQALQVAQVCESLGFKSGIYSSQGWFDGNISQVGQKRLANLKLWLADWDNRPSDIGDDISPWQALHTKQYAGDVGGLCGIQIDMNWRPQSVWDAELERPNVTLDELLSQKVPVLDWPLEDCPTLHKVLLDAIFAWQGVDEKDGKLRTELLASDKGLLDGLSGLITEDRKKLDQLALVVAPLIGHKHKGTFELG
jgi:hypothetical protein